MTMSHIEAVDASSSGNPGEILRQAREARDWQLAEVAAQLNLTAQSLAHLEAGEFERLPGNTFARGYVRAYAKLLGLDQAELVAIFDRYTGTNSAGSAVHSLGQVSEPMRLSRTVLRGVSGLLLLLLLAFGYVWWQEHPERLADLGVFGLKHIEVESADGTTELHPLDEPEEPEIAVSQPATTPAPSSEAAAPAASGEGTSEPSPAEPASVPGAAVAQPGSAPAGEAVQPSPSTTPGALQPLPAVAAPAGSEQPAGDAAAPVAAATEPAEPVAAEPEVEPTPQVAPGEGLIQLSFTADCWLEISDANGRVLLSTIKHGGESLQVSGKAPLQLRLGNARGVAQLRYNGEPVNHLAKMTARGTARLKLGQ